jgi:putative oxidoreductase
MDPIDLALLVVRVGVGVTLALHGVNKLRGGVQGTARWFESMGMRPGLVNAWMAALTEIGAGLAFAAGLFTPVAGAAMVALMWVAGIVAHRGAGFFVFRRPTEGWEYVMVLAIVAVGVSTIGGGRASLDHALGVFPAFFDDWWGLVIAAAGGTAGAALQLAAAWRPPARSGKAA